MNVLLKVKIEFSLKAKQLFKEIIAKLLDLILYYQRTVAHAAVFLYIDYE